jgi:hypothetical protein
VNFFAVAVAAVNVVVDVVVVVDFIIVANVV